MSSRSHRVPITSLKPSERTTLQTVAWYQRFLEGICESTTSLRPMGSSIVPPLECPPVASEPAPQERNEGASPIRFEVRLNPPPATNLERFVAGNTPCGNILR